MPALRGVGQRFGLGGSSPSARPLRKYEISDEVTESRTGVSVTVACTAAAAAALPPPPSLSSSDCASTACGRRAAGRRAARAARACVELEPELKVAQEPVAAFGGGE